MVLSARCKTCKSGKVRKQTLLETKSDYARSKGKILILKCGKCRSEAQYHINEMHARSLTLRILAYIILVITSILIISGAIVMAPEMTFYHYMATHIKAIMVIATIPYTVSGIILTAAVRRERAYNQYKVAD